MLSLIVKIQDKLYGLPSSQVEHIYPCPYIENGKLNYHGTVIKVIDMAIFFKLRNSSNYNINTPLVIVKHKNIFGLLVDEVLAVESLEHESWKGKKIEAIDLASVFSRSESSVK